MLRVTWEKTSNPYIRLATSRDRPRLATHRKLMLTRPRGSKYSQPITAHLFFDGTDAELAQATELVLDVPGGGFICMTPVHHEERLLRWAQLTRRPVISFDYGKAPEYPFPFAVDEMRDAYALLVRSKGAAIGMNKAQVEDVRMVLTGDSAGANIGIAMCIRILEDNASLHPGSPDRLPLPVALVDAYAALDFNFTSWMTPENLRVLRAETASALRRTPSQGGSSALPSVTQPTTPRLHRVHSRAGSWTSQPTTPAPPPAVEALQTKPHHFDYSVSPLDVAGALIDDDANAADDAELDDSRSTKSDTFAAKLRRRGSQWILRQMTPAEPPQPTQEELARARERELARRKRRAQRDEYWQTNLTMTSRTAFFNDRIISPAMCRAMAILYIGPHNAPDLQSDYHISPIFTPAHLLAHFPPVYLQCGERDPFVDDTVIFAGRIREAKEARKAAAIGSLRAQRRKRTGGATHPSLQFSTPTSGVQDDDDLLNSPDADPIVRESEDDWTQIRIFEGWSHGYLQMVTILAGAEDAIAMLAQWINDAFDKDAAKRGTVPTVAVRQEPSRQTMQDDEDEEKHVDDDEILSFTPRKPQRKSTAVVTSSGSSASASASSSSSELARLSPVLVQGVTSPAHTAITTPSRGPTSASGSGSSVTAAAVAPVSPPVGPTSPPLVATPSSPPIAQQQPAPGLAARDLLLRRRQDAVYGISATSSGRASRAGSDDETTGPGEGTAASALNDALREHAGQPISLKDPPRPEAYAAARRERSSSRARAGSSAAPPLAAAAPEHHSSALHNELALASEGSTAPTSGTNTPAETSSVD